MRETLFRGKREDNGEWVIGYLVRGKDYLYENEMTTIFSTDTIFYPYTETSGYNRVIPKTVGQFTGRLDENFNKIFEGDILEVSYDDGTAYTTEVRAYGSTLCVDIEGEDYNFTAIDFAVDIWKDNCCEYKVIGNVFDNPELLEEL